MAFNMGGPIPSKNPTMRKQKEPQGQVVLSNRCIETQAQIQNVLQIMGTTASALSTHRPTNIFGQESGDAPREAGPMTEGQIALENTLRNACERMDKILTNDSLWNDEFQRKVEKEYEELHRLQMETIERQKAAAAEVTSPHFRYRPELQKLRNGQWMAILGDAQQLEFAIYGIGDSAQQAMEEFDHVFLKGVPRSLELWLEKRRTDMDDGRTPEPFPNQTQNTNTNDNEKMDSGGDEPSNSDAGSR